MAAADSIMTDPIPVIDSILLPREKAKWVKLDDTYELVLLHRKFWVQGDYDKLLNADEDEDASEDDEGAAEVIEGAVEDDEGATAVIEGAAEDDDDVGPECHILDLGTPGPGRSKLWVRKEFIRMYKRCKYHFKAHGRADKSPSLVVTGQPGIGKRYWLLYVLCRRLARKKPIMWYYGKKLHLFVEDGVYEAPTDHLSTEFKTRVWTLVYPDNSKNFPESLAVPDTKLMIVFTTSPQMERWKGLSKTTTCAPAFMNPWTRGAPVRGFAPSNLAKVHEMYTRYGPTPRICFDYLITRAPLDEHSSKLGDALSTLSLRSLQRMINNSSRLKMDEVSHTMLLMKRRGSNLSRALFTLEPITPTVMRAIRNQFSREMRADRLGLYHSLSNAAQSRLLAGIVYESLVQETLQQMNTIELHLIPMTRVDISSRWCSNHGDGADPSSMLSINICREANDGFSSKPDSIKEKVYYAPDFPNQAAFDSFIMDNNRLFIFQFTIADVYDINKKIITFFSQASLPPRANWYFIFVVPPLLSELKCPQSSTSEMKAFQEEIHLCTMLVDPQL